VTSPRTPDGPPSLLTAGDTWRWRVPDLSEYPQADGWALKYQLAGLGTLAITPTYATTGDDAGYWVVEVAAATTAAIEAGGYKLYAWVEGSGTYAGRKDPLGWANTITVAADPRTAEPGELVSQAQKNLTAVQTIIAARLSGDVPRSYTVAGRSVEKMTMDELRKLERQYAEAVRQEQGVPVGRRHLAAFTRA